MLSDLTDLSSSFSAIDLAGRKRVIVALSGGGDSLALLFLLHDYVKKHAYLNVELLAVTVDHNLRPEAANEARQVADLCTQHGIAHRTVRWEAVKPTAGISEAAREARQDLLAQAAIEAGSDLILLAHTADDQAETTHMRMSRGSGRGLAGIAPATLYDSRVWFVRPLLNARRSDLRNVLSGRSIQWIDDPTNTDVRFERARVRQSLTEQDTRHLLDVAATVAQERQRLGAEVALLMREHVCLCSPGLLRLSKAFLQEMQRDASTYLIRIVLAIAGGASHLPDHERASELLEKMLRGSARATLSRAVISSHRDHLYLHREHRNLPDLPLREGFLWDRRYRVTAAISEESVRIAPVGTEAARQLEIDDLSIPKGLARAAFAAEPAVWHGAEPAGWLCNSHPGIVGRPVLGPWATLIPSFDYEPASAMSEVLGCRKLPERPWDGHKQV